MDCERSTADVQHLIGGAWRAPTAGLTVALFDPATGQPTGLLPVGNSADVDAAVQAAAAAFSGPWRDTRMGTRVELLARIGEMIAAWREQFAAVISCEIGAPIDFARAHQVDAAVRHIEATVEAARALDDADPAISYEPIGVAALITPWNWPLNQVVLKVAGSLVAGGTIVLKPSELSTRTALLFAECVTASGAPPGVFNVVVGDGTTGALLAAHPGVGAVSFTGSTATGQLVAHAAVDGMKRVTLELGGKSANLVFADCDLPTAIRQGVAHCFRNAGQSCNAASRMLVERSVYQRAVQLAADAANATRVGHPGMAGGHLGPLVSGRQFERVQRFIATGVTEGARLVAGGVGRPNHLEQGYYCKPTVFADVTPEMTVFQEEIFGPVLAMTPFDTEDEAITLANATRYGLAAFVQTGDSDRAKRVAGRLRAGMVQINAASRAPGAPFGGVKYSGIGREAGVWGIRAFQEVKSVSGLAK